MQKVRQKLSISKEVECKDLCRGTDLISHLSIRGDDLPQRGGVLRGEVLGPRHLEHVGVDGREVHHVITVVTNGIYVPIILHISCITWTNTSHIRVSIAVPKSTCILLLHRSSLLTARDNL